ncbi:hypothetical protein ACR6C2_08535 [Streptomyces sp. INA 01156]
MADWMYVAGACFAGSGALALAVMRYGRRAAALEAAGPARLHVGDGQHGSASPDTGGLEADPFSPYEDGDADTAEFHYCPYESQVTAHAVHTDGVRHCWNCAADQEEA